MTGLLATRPDAARDVIARRDRDRLAALAEDDPELGLRHGPLRVAPHANRAAWSHCAAHLRILHEQLRPVGVVHERVDVPRIGARLFHPCVTTALVRDAGAPDLGRLDRRQEADVDPVEPLDDVAVAPDRPVLLD
jgi:hypothetical protein